MFTRFARTLCIAALSLAATTAPVLAQAWPNKPIQIIVPFPAGGPADILARVLAPKISAKLGQPVIIENRGGGGGTIGIQAAIQAQPDGYTFGFGTHGALAALPHIMKVAYTLDDIQFLTVVARVPQVLAVSNESGIHSFQDLLRIAKANPGKLNYGSAGKATTTHLGGELLRQEAGIDIVHVPYRGAAPAVIGLMSNDVQIFPADLSAVLEFVKSGKIKAVVINGPRRAEQLPNIPTTAELGLPNVNVETIYGLIAGKAVPTDIANKFREAAVSSLNEPDLKQQIATQGATAATSTSEEYKQVMQSEYKKWGEVIKKGGITLD
jgi:tripartite-type tricarboxylate transporter receptor subunit TctC